jgi:hypothetical protein
MKTILLLFLCCNLAAQPKYKPPKPPHVIFTPKQVEKIWDIGNDLVTVGLLSSALMASYSLYKADRRLLINSGKYFGCFVVIDINLQIFKPKKKK